MTLDNIDFLKLMPNFLREDEFVIALSDSLNPVFRGLSQDTKLHLLQSNLDAFTEPELDLLSIDLDCTWYDSSLKIDAKRQLLSQAISVHMIKGTKAAVEMVVNTIFGSGRVAEWFEFNGVPGTFRIITSNKDATESQAQRLIKTIDAVKRATSKLDRVVIELVASISNVRVGMAVHIKDTLTVR